MRQNHFAHFDGDGRLIWPSRRIWGPTCRYHNTGAKPGLRAQLAGPPGKPQALGAVLTGLQGPSADPARETHAGSGFWPPDAATQIIALPAGPVSLKIRWPGGRVTINIFQNQPGKSW